MATFTVTGDNFTLDGAPVRIIAGAIHYFRVAPDYWRDRLLKLKACGLNTVETYVPWNAHEPRPGVYDFSGMLDLERYLEIAAELGLWAIVRPGPYICSEWDFGGLPWWLLADPSMRVRCSHPPYLAAVDRYFDELIPRLARFQISRGGPLIAMQVENEYGSNGSDKVYLRHLVNGLRTRDIDALLFTSDGGCDWMLEGGTLPDVLKVVNFGSKAEENFTKLREHQPQGPLMCGEFWNGWFDHWGEEHHYRDPLEAAQVLDDMLALGASVSFYMFHGGTTFGFMPGANHRGQYQPDVTSYDYGAPISEAGDLTEKYHACRAVIGKYAPLPDITLPAPAPKRAYGTVVLSEQAWLFDILPALSQEIMRPTPEPMEMFDQGYGFILYRTRLHGPREECPLVLQDVHDRALVFVNGEYRGILERDNPESTLALAFAPGDYQLDLLVESMGRVNYGPQMMDRKGITEGARLSNQFLYNWSIYPLPLDDLSRISFQPGTDTAGPIFRRGTFTVDHPADTFLELPGWTKGIVFLNGFNLGRYWEIGPQHTLYIPAPLLRVGENELIVFELHEMQEARVVLGDQAKLR